MLCSGKNNCVLPVGHIVADGIHPCPVEVMSYLEADYKCLKGNDISILN